MGFVNSVASCINVILCDLYVFNTNYSRFVMLQSNLDARLKCIQMLQCCYWLFPNVIKIGEHNNKYHLFHNMQIVKKQRFYFSIFQIVGGLITVVMSTETQ